MRNFWGLVSPHTECQPEERAKFLEEFFLKPALSKSWIESVVGKQPKEDISPPTHSQTDFVQNTDYSDED